MDNSYHVVRRRIILGDIAVSIKQTEIKSIEYRNDFTMTPGTQVKLEVKTKAGVILNMATPLSAVVEVTFVAHDTEDDKVKFELHTCTPVTASSFIDNLDKVIEEQYLSSIMLAVNEKIRFIATAVGMNIRVPGITLPFKE